MHIVKLIMTGFLINLTISSANAREKYSQYESILSDNLKQMRNEFLKTKILKKLYVSEAPKLKLPKPPPESLRIIAEMAETHINFQKDDKSNSEAIVIYPREGEYFRFIVKFKTIDLTLKILPNTLMYIRTSVIANTFLYMFPLC